MLSRLRCALRFDARDGDSLVSELRNKFERTAESFDVSMKCCDLAVVEVGTGFETRDVGLVDLGLLCHVDLGLATASRTVRNVR